MADERTISPLAYVLRGSFIVWQFLIVGVNAACVLREYSNQSPSGTCAHLRRTLAREICLRSNCAGIQYPRCFMASSFSWLGHEMVRRNAESASASTSCLSEAASVSNWPACSSADFPCAENRIEPFRT